MRNFPVGDRHQVLLGVTGSGKTFTMAKVIRRPAPGAGAGAQQDAGGPALPRVQGFFPATRSFRPTTTLPRPASRRPTPTSKGRAGQRRIDWLRPATRSLFERRDCVIVAAFPDLRPGVAGGLLRDAPVSGKGGADLPRRDSAPAGGDAVRAPGLRPGTRLFPRPGGRRGGLPLLRGLRGPHRAVRRRDRRAFADRPAHGPHPAQVRPYPHLPEIALRPAPGRLGEAMEDPRRARGTSPLQREDSCWRRAGCTSARCTTWR